MAAATSFTVEHDAVPEAARLSLAEEAKETGIPLQTRSYESLDHDKQAPLPRTKIPDERRNSPWTPYFRRRGKTIRVSQAYPLPRGIKFCISQSAPWTWETLSWLTALCFMAATVTVLVVYDQKTIPQWHWGLTINALVSVLVTFTRSALMVPVSEAIGQLKWLWFRDQRILEDFEKFDDASRGPWGSLGLLWRLKGWYAQLHQRPTCH